MKLFHTLAMRRVRRIGAGIFILAASPLLALPALAAPMDGCAGRVQVSGEGELRASPDLAVILAGVSSRADSADAAMAQTSAAQTAVIVALKEAGLADADIQTSGLRLNPLRDYQDRPKVLGYEASNMVSVRVADLTRLGEALDRIVAAGANEISGIEFRLADADASQDQARRAAVADARHKAELLAGAAGVALGPVIEIRDAGYGGRPQPVRMMASEMARSAPVPVQPGEVSVTAQVQIDYALETVPGACSGNSQAGAQ